MSFTICVNMPGCLPETDPYKVEDIGAAREALVHELERSSEGFNDTPEFTELGDAIEQAHTIGEDGGTVIFAGYVHCITPTEED